MVICAPLAEALCCTYGMLTSLFSHAETKSVKKKPIITMMFFSSSQRPPPQGRHGSASVFLFFVSDLLAEECGYFSGEKFKKFPCSWAHRPRICVLQCSVRGHFQVSLLLWVEVVLKTGTVWLPKRRQAMISFFSYSIIYLNNEKLFWSHKMCIHKK